MKPFLTATLSILALTTVSGAAHAESVKTEAQFRTALSGPGSLSLAESKLAESKATNPKVKEFAKFEVAEQTALATVLKELKTPEPEMSEKDKSTLQKLKDAKGAAFDKAYLEAQIEGHKTLSDITGSYLDANDSASSDPKELEARHLALVAHQTITQHLTNAKQLNSELK